MCECAVAWVGLVLIFYHSNHAEARPFFFKCSVDPAIGQWNTPRGIWETKLPLNEQKKRDCVSQIQNYRLKLKKKQIESLRIAHCCSLFFFALKTLHFRIRHDFSKALFTTEPNCTEMSQTAPRNANSFVIGPAVNKTDTHHQISQDQNYYWINKKSRAFFFFPQNDAFRNRAAPPWSKQKYENAEAKRQSRTPKGRARSRVAKNSVKRRRKKNRAHTDTHKKVSDSRRAHITNQAKQHKAANFLCTPKGSSTKKKRKSSSS